MLTQISVPVDSDVALAFQSASEEDRRKLGLLISLQLREATQSRESLETVMNDVAQRAKRRGLTPEILESLLHER
jgi:hypothetical protein